MGRNSARVGILLLLLILCAGPASSVPANTQKSPAVSRQGPADRASLEAFLDGVIAAQMEAHNISGVTISVVSEEEIVLAKGYGHAHFAKRKPVDPANSLFRIGSVSKLFTWTAVMQLVEEGKLDLDADVNVYLDRFEIPETFGEPITMAHLMAHTPGFEDHVIGLFARREARLRPLGNILAREMPQRVRPPNQLASYSNYGSALAGYIVERISGMPWEVYIETKILQPLQMMRTTVRQPIPAELAEDLSAGYSWSEGMHIEKPFEFVPLTPAASMSASAADMARFMLALLKEGSLGSVRILSEESFRKMQSPLFRHSPQLNAMLHGFYEMSSNGQRIIGHGGDTFWFHSQLMLLPEQNLGLFVSYNCDTGAAARNDLVRAFLDHYYPVASVPEPEATPELRRRSDRLEGYYAPIRVSSSTLAKLAVLMSAVRVSSTDTGELVTRGGMSPRRWLEVEPRLYRRTIGQDKLLFQEDDQGRITHMFMDSVPMVAFARLGFTETPLFHFSILGSSAFLLLCALVVWPAGAYRHRHDNRAGAPPRTARLLAWVMGFLNIAFLGALTVALSNPTEIAFGVPRLVRYVIPLPLTASAFLFGAVIFTVLAWTRGYWSLMSRLFFTLVTLAGLALLWWFHYWNLLGYHFGGWTPA